MSAGVVRRLTWDQRIFSRGSLTWLGSWCEASVLHVGISMGLLECSQDMAAGSPQGGQFKREKARKELYPFWDSALEIAQYPFCCILFIKNELPSVVFIQGEGITLYLFKREVSKNSWTYLKVLYLVGCGPQLNPALLSGKFFYTLCECVQTLFTGWAN